MVGRHRSNPVVEALIAYLDITHASQGVHMLCAVHIAFPGKEETTSARAAGCAAVLQAEPGLVAQVVRAHA